MNLIFAFPRSLSAVPGQDDWLGRKAPRQENPTQ
jgi:hypothetical protein